jgi:ubiquitin-conjugating enzyme E2 S
MALPVSVVKAITAELHDLQQRPCEGIRIIVNEDDIADVQAEIEGPTGTPYEGGVFRMRLCIGSDFPNTAPKGHFITKIWHPNVSKAGEICVNVLKRDWKPDLGLRHVLLVIRCLLIEPFPESALNEEAGMALLENYEEYSRYAKLWTSLHAAPSKRPMPLTASGAVNNAGNTQAGEASGSAPQGDGSPMVKKPKAIGGDKKPANAAAVKARKSLKRL